MREEAKIKQRIMDAPDGVDGSVGASGHGPMMTLSLFSQALVKRPDGRLTPEDRRARAQAFSILCHMSVLFGLPMFLAPFFKRDEPYGLHHAKASAVNFTTFHAAMLAAVVVHPGFFALVLASYLPAWVGIWRAARGQRVGIFGLGPIGELAFFWLKPKPEPVALLEADAQAPNLLT